MVTRPSGRSIRTFVHPRKVPAPPSGTLAAALAYWQRGFNVLPVTDQKTPALRKEALEWDRWQAYRQQPADVGRLFAGDPPGVGVLTGTFGNLTALDIDGRAGEALLVAHGITLPITPEVRTSAGRRQLWFRAAQPVTIRRTDHQLELHGPGRYVVAPPSRHPSGQRYRWREGRSLEDVPLAPLPEELVRFLQGLGREKTQPEKQRRPRAPRVPTAEFRSPLELLLHRVPKGSRNRVRGSIAGHCYAAGLALEEAQQAALAHNRLLCDPPAGEARVRADIAGFYKTARQNEVDRLTRTVGPQRIAWRTWRRLVREKQLRPGPLAMFEALMDHADAAGRCWPGDHYLAKIIRTHVRKIRQAREELVRAGLVAVRVCRQHPTVYRLAYLVR